MNNLNIQGKSSNYTRTSDKNVLRSHMDKLAHEVQAHLNEIFLWEDLESIAGSPSREKEKMLLDLVATGNYEAISKNFETLCAMGFPPQVQKKIDQKDVFHLQMDAATAVILCSRAAIDHGLPEPLANVICENYFRLIKEYQNSPEQLALLAFLPGKSFALSLNDWYIKQLNIHVHICYRYIISHIEESISLHDLAKVCDLAPNYISDLFQRELGQRPIAFIRKQKLRAASQMLVNTTQPVSQVAETYSFPSTSAFIKQFKEEYGVTPHQYRMDTSKIKADQVF